jgi:hypothetical protein
VLVEVLFQRCEPARVSRGARGVNCTNGLISDLDTNAAAEEHDVRQREVTLSEFLKPLVARSERTVAEPRGMDIRRRQIAQPWLASPSHRLIQDNKRAVR